MNKIKGLRFCLCCFLAHIVLVPSVIFAENKIFSLPFYEPANLLQGWFYNDGKIHKGIDYKCSVGDPIYAVADGLAMHSTQKLNSTYAYGNFVLIKHVNGFASLYAHLSKVNDKIAKFPEKQRGNTDYDKWTSFKKGDYVGDCGKTGTISPHLHFETTKGKYGVDKIDAYDLYKVSVFYPFNKKYTVMGKNHLWESEPPKYLEIKQKEPEPKPSKKSFWDKVKGWFNTGNKTNQADSTEGEIIAPEELAPEPKVEEQKPDEEEKEEEVEEEETFSLAFTNSNENITTAPGQEVKVVVKVKNTGTAEWKRQNISTNVVGGLSVNKKFYHNSWVTSLRPSLLDQQNVPAGKSGTFSFVINTPEEAGDYQFRIQVVRTDAGFEQIEGGFWKVNIKVEEEKIEEPEEEEPVLQDEIEEEEEEEETLVDKVVKGIKEVAEDVKKKVKRIFSGGGGGGGGSSSPPPDDPPPAEPEPEEEPEPDEPVIEILSHSTSSIYYTATSTTTISGTKNDVVAKIILNASSTIEYTSSTWSAGVELNEGENLLEICGEREDGKKTATTTISFFLDTTVPEPPTVSVSQSEFTTSTLYVSWSSVEGERFDVEYASGGEWLSLFEKTTSTEYSMEVDRLNSYSFRARVYDAMKNVSDWSASSTILVDWPKDVVINEVAWAGTGPTSRQTNDEWIELYNNTDSDIDLSNWKIFKSGSELNFKKIINPTIPAKGYFLLERTDDDSVLNISADVLYTGGLGNGGEDLILLDENENIIDQVNCTGGWYNLADSAMYRTMARNDSSLPGSLESNWESYGGVSPNAGRYGGGMFLGSPKYKNTGNWLIAAPYYYYSYLLDENNKIILGLENSPYVIDYETKIPAGYTIQIEPGVVLYGRDRSSYFKVGGELILNGTEENPIIITSALDQNFVQENLSILSGNPAPGDWSRISIQENGSLSGNFVKFLYGGHEVFFSLDGMSASKKIAQVISNVNGSLNLNNTEFLYNYYNEALYPDYNAVIWSEFSNSSSTAHISNTLINNAKNGIMMKGGILSLDNVQFNNMSIGIEILNQKGEIQTQNMSPANFTKITEHNWFPENIWNFASST